MHIRSPRTDSLRSLLISHVAWTRQYQAAVNFPARSSCTTPANRPSDRIPANAPAMTEKPSNGQSIQADKCCDTCKRMTGTLEGLQALVSPVGYTHLDFENIKRSGSRGCKLCKMIYLERFPGEKSPIQVFAKMTNTNAHAVPSKPKHGGIIDGLRLPYIEDNGILQNDLEFTAFVTTSQPFPTVRILHLND